MKRLNLFVIKAFIGPFFASLVITIFILLLQFVLKNAERLIGKGLDYSILMEFFGYGIAGLLPMALPLAILMAALMTFGNMGEHYELTAAKSAGVSLIRLMMPLAVLVSLIAAATFYFSIEILPVTNRKLAMLTFEITRLRPELTIEPGAYNTDINEYTIKVDRKNTESGMMYGFIIYDHADAKGNTSMSYADSATLKFTSDNKNMVLTMYNGYSYIEGAERKDEKAQNYPLRRNLFGKQTAIIDVKQEDIQGDFLKLQESPYIWSQKELVKKSIYFLYQRDSAVVSLNQIYNGFILTSANKKDSVFESLNSKKIILNTDSLFNSKNAEEISRILPAIANITGTMAHYSNQINKYGSWQYFISARMMIAWHKKYSLSFIVIVFFFIGASLGAIIRKGSMGLPAVISIAIFIFFYIITLMGEKFILKGVTNALLGIWVPIAVMAALAIFLTYKAATDSTMLSMEAYVKFINKISGNNKPLK